MRENGCISPSSARPERIARNEHDESRPATDGTDMPSGDIPDE
jgi:hypothetical protein